MRRPGTAVAALLGVLLGALLVGGCGVRPTGVIDAGEPASGLTKGLRLYYVSEAGRLEGVSRPDTEIRELAAVIKLLMAPTEAERRTGLSTLVMFETYEVTGGGDRVTLHVPGVVFEESSVENRNLTGQLVCSLARASAVLDKRGRTRPDDVQVTIRPEKGSLGPYVCSDFLK